MNINNITTTTPITFNQFYTLLVNHDWFYEYSDSTAVQSEQRSNESTLISIAKRHDFTCYVFSHFCNVRNSSIQGGSVVRQTLVQLKDNWSNMSVITLGVKK